MVSKNTDVDKEFKFAFDTFKDEAEEEDEEDEMVRRDHVKLGEEIYGELIDSI